MAIKKALIIARQRIVIYTNNVLTEELSEN